MYIFFFLLKKILLRKLCLFISQRCVQSLSDVLESIPFNLCLPSSGILPSSVREGLLNSEEQCFWLLFYIGAVFGPLYFWREWPSTCFSWRISFLSCVFPKRWLLSRRWFCFLCMFLTCLFRLGSKEPLIFGLPQQRSSSFWIRLVLLVFLQPFLIFLWRVFSLSKRSKFPRSRGGDFGSVNFQNQFLLRSPFPSGISTDERPGSLGIWWRFG